MRGTTAWISASSPGLSANLSASSSSPVVVTRRTTPTRLEPNSAGAAVQSHWAMSL